MKYVFIASPGRAGLTILQATLDGHPDLLVFPLEFNILYTYNVVRQNSGKLTASTLADYLKNYTRFRHIGDVMKVEIGQDVDLSFIDEDIFWGTLREANDEISERKCLDLLANAYIKSINSRRDGYKYFGLMTT